MRLSEFTDYTLRVLMYCATHRGRLVTIAEMAEHHGLSKNHLMKVVNDLAHQGWIETTRGRGGGLRLLREPGDIRIGDIVRGSETDFRLVECFDSGTNACRLTPRCRLKHLFGEALQGFFKALDGATLADMTASAPVAKRGPPGKPTASPVALPQGSRRARQTPAARRRT
ncbi:MAG: Rrf2 family transcriptional regulator [Rubrivivax sp.]|nr:Rrf2 family transcriptional regulator [Rubrivivax sp.]